MLENEPNDKKSEEQRGTAEPITVAAAGAAAGAGAATGAAAAGSAEAGAAAGAAASPPPAKATRTRRTRATRPAGPPVADVPPPQTGSNARAGQPGSNATAGSATASPTQASGSATAPPAQASGSATAPPVFSPPEPSAGTFHPTQPPAPTGFTAPEPPAPEGSGAEPPGRAAQATFQAPQLIFQPPETTPASALRKSDDSAPAAADGDEPGQPGDQGGDDTGRSRRRRGGRGRSKSRSGENGDDAAAQDEKAAADDGAKDSSNKDGKAKAGAKDGGGKAGAKDGSAKGGSAKDGSAKDGSAKDGSAKDGSAKDGSGKSSGDDGAKAAGGAEDEAGDGGADGEADGETAGRRRRRRRKRGGSSDSDQPSPDDPPGTVVHVREPRSSGRGKAKDEVQGLKGSTRLEAKRQRRREGRDSGRRRPPIITESEFLARREAVDRSMVVRQRGEHTQIAVLEDDILVEHYVDRTSHQSFVGNVYLGKVQNVLPSMEAAFVDIGKGRNAVLYAGEVNFDASGLEGQTRRIESALKSGQSVLVQVTKDPVGHKGARLTSQVSLPGRYLVYVPGASMTGISRKLPDTERTRLKQILKQVMPEGAGVIVRTAAEGATEEELAQDVSRLSAQWETIERKSKSASPPALLSSEPDLTIRVIRDIFNEDFGRLIVSGDDGWDMVDEYVRYVAPHLIERLSRWQDAEDVFAHYRIDEQLAKALDRKVWLPSGGSLVIDKTEAMTVIDVNTGKFTGQGGNLEETVTRNNLEAAEEIVRQLRLRDIGGILVIDFIDMVLESNRDLVLRRLLECLARDRTKHQVAEVTSLGLVQMTRKRVGSGLLEAFSVTCECCNGRGLHVSLEPTEQPTATPRQRGDDRGSRGSGGDDKPSGSSSSSRRRRRKSAAATADTAPTGNGAAEAVAAIASASADSTAATASGSDDPHPNGQSEAEAEADPKAKAATDPKAEADPKAKADADPKADAAPKAKAGADPKAKAEAKTDTKPKAGGKRRSRARSKANSEPKTDAEPKADGEPRADGKSESGTEPKADAELKANGDSRSEAQPKADAEPKESSSVTAGSEASA